MQPHAWWNLNTFYLLVSWEQTIKLLSAISCHHQWNLLLPNFHVRPLSCTCHIFMFPWNYWQFKHGGNKNRFHKNLPFFQCAGIHLCFGRCNPTQKFPSHHLNKAISKADRYSHLVTQFNTRQKIWGKKIPNIYKKFLLSLTWMFLSNL